jgi:cytoskeleton protein RodZ
MPSVGEILRNARLRHGLSLAQVETQTRIRLKFLDALESDRFDDIPGKFFVRSFSLQYGAKLAVNLQELQEALDRQLPSTGPETQTSSPKAKPITVPRLVGDGVGPRGGDRLWVYSLAGLLAVLVLCSGVYMAWLRFSQGPPANEAAQVTPRSTPAARPTPAPTPTPEAVAPIVPAQNAPAQNADVPVTSQVAGGRIAINISAKEDTWVQVTIDGKVVFADVLKPGENRVLSATQNARLRLGNAGGVDLRFNGTTIGAVGPRGQVRTVEFTPENFLIVEPQKKPAPTPVANNRSV